MKTEKELKEEIEKCKKELIDFVKDLKNEPEPSFIFLMSKDKLLINATKVEAQLKTLQERNAEVKQVIEKWEKENKEVLTTEEIIKNKVLIADYIKWDKIKELLKKLGLNAKTRNSEGEKE